MMMAMLLVLGIGVVFLRPVPMVISMTLAAVPPFAMALGQCVFAGFSGTESGSRQQRGADSSPDDISP
jgi:hypothetical protein